MPAIRVKQTRKEMSSDRISLRGVQRSCGRIFFDSGAHSLYTIHVIQKGHSEGYDWYKSKEFVRYVDEYADFIKTNKRGMDWYANVDVIFNPRLSWQVQKYLEEKHGLNPVPVIHYGTPLTWVDKHLEAGYKFLGIGGLGQEAGKQAYLLWADRLYNHLCDNRDRLPCVKTHGFAMSSYDLMIRYPWYSVDSASWAKAAGFGLLYVPHKRKGKFDFGERPYVIGIGHRSRFRKHKGQHYNNLSPLQQKVVREWLEYIDVPIGSMKKDGKTVKEYGAVSQYNARAIANLRFFQEVCKWLPKWPWPFKVSTKEGFISWELVR